MKEGVLTFVYNVNGDVLNVSIDYLHKFLSPSTYECNLCLLTHHNFGEKNEWKNFLRELDMPTRFMYKDEFVKTYPALKHVALPAIFLQKETIPELIVTSEELKSYSSLDTFTRALKNKLVVS
jgi:hypothetical protein